jgi:heat shock protein HspQ
MTLPYSQNVGNTAFLFLWQRKASEVFYHFFEENDETSYIIPYLCLKQTSVCKQVTAS